MFQEIIYNLFLKSYELAVMAAALRSEKAKKWLKGRKNIFREIGEAINSKNVIGGRRIWMHCASLGEFEQGRPLLEKLKSEQPQAIIILTFFSPSGYELRKNYPVADFVFYLPLDSERNAAKFIALTKPDLAIFVKYEFWYYYFKCLNDNNIPLIMLSAVFRKEQLFFRWYGGLQRKMLQFVTHFFVQDEKSLKLLQTLGFNNATQIPDTRIDRVFQIKQNVKSIAHVNDFLQGTKAFFGGSIYEAENQMIANAYFQNKINKKIILAPHNVDAENIEKLLAAWKGNAIRYSEINQDQNFRTKNILIIDSIGLLASLYQYAKIAFIGGGFGKSIHNTLEAVVFGVPVLFGPKYEKFKEAHDLIAAGGAFVISDEKHFFELVSALQQDKKLYEKASSACKSYIEENLGGTEKVYIWLRERMLD